MGILRSSEKRPDGIGVRSKMLAPCPERPNCVSSQAEEGDVHYIAPFLFSSGAGEAFAVLIEVLAGMKRVTIITQSEEYLHAECRTRVGFVDDLEFYWHPEEGVCHVRSASRLGYSDLGKNRARVEAIRGQCLARKSESGRGG
jgi:uncharacterized protein (DUF1499 family)